MRTKIGLVVVALALSGAVSPSVVGSASATLPAGETTAATLAIGSCGVPHHYLDNWGAHGPNCVTAYANDRQMVVDEVTAACAAQGKDLCSFTYTRGGCFCYADCVAYGSAAYRCTP